MPVGFDAKNSAEKMFQSFGPNSSYDRSQSVLYRRGVSNRSAYPINGKWRNFLLRRFVDCYSSKTGSVEASVDDDASIDPDNIVRNIPLVAFLAGKNDFLETLQQSILQLQYNEMMMAVVMGTSRIIERYILNASHWLDVGEKIHPIEQVVQDLRDPDRVSMDSLDTAMISHFNQVLGSRNMSLKDASAKFGAS